MTSVIILAFLAGVLFVGGLPHLVKGVMGKSYVRGRESPMISVVWGWLNWVVAVLLWHIAPMRFHARAAFVGTAIGVLVAALLMSNMRKPAGRVRKED
ncbi:MAG: hypothetical protein ACREGG_04945 [Candidatus Saccharimonadales bacterium]